MCNIVNHMCFTYAFNSEAIPQFTLYFHSLADVYITGPKNENLELIIGLSAGLGGALIILIFILLLCCCCPCCPLYETCRKGELCIDFEFHSRERNCVLNRSQQVLKTFSETVYKMKLIRVVALMSDYFTD